MLYGTALLLGEKLVRPVEDRQKHQCERRPGHGNEFAALFGVKPDVVAQFCDGFDNLAASDRGDEVAYEEEEGRKASQTQVGQDDDLPGFGYEKDGPNGGEEGQSDKEGCNNVHRHDCLDDLGDIVEFLLNALGETQVCQVQ